MFHSLGWTRGWRGRPKISTKVMKFVVVDGVIIFVREVISREDIRGCVVAVIFVGVDKEIRAPFDDQTTVLKKRLPFMGGHGLNAGNDGVIHGEGIPLVSGNAGARGQGQEIVIAICVAGRGKGDGTDRTRFRGVCRVVGFKNLRIGAEFDVKFIEIGRRNGGH